MSEIDLSEQIQNMDDDLSASALMECDIYSTHSSIELLDIKEEIDFEESEKKWCVVEFDDGVQLVPLQWISNGNWCRFPNYKSTVRYEKAVKNYELSVSSWPIYAVKILGIYDSYEMAKIKLKVADGCHDTSSPERVRRRKRPAQSVELGNPDDSRRRRNSARNAPSTPAETVADPAPSVSPAIVQNEVLNIQQIHQLKASIKHNSNEIRDIHLKLDEILELMKNSSSIPVYPVMSPEYLNSNINIEFPLKTIEEIENLDEKLKDVEFSVELISVLSRIGGTSGESEGVRAAYKLVDHLFSPEVLTYFSWTGISKEKGMVKQSFQKFTYILNVFQKVIELADTRYSVQKNMMFFRDKILKHSRQRTLRKKIIDIRPTEDKSTVLICNLDSGMGLEENYAQQ